MWYILPIGTNWGIIWYLPPIKGTRKLHWYGYAFVIFKRYAVCGITGRVFRGSQCQTAKPSPKKHQKTRLSSHFIALLSRFSRLSTKKMMGNRRHRPTWIRKILIIDSGASSSTKSPKMAPGLCIFLRVARSLPTVRFLAVTTLWTKARIWIDLRRMSWGFGFVENGTPPCFFYKYFSSY